MAIIDSTLDLQSFYPPDLKIFCVEDTDDKIIIHMHSTSTSCTCHRGGALLNQHHESHHRTVQDLPILGKQYALYRFFPHLVDFVAKLFMKQYFCLQ